MPQSRVRRLSSSSQVKSPPQMNSLFQTFIWVILLIAGCILWLVAYTANTYNYHFQRRQLESTETVMGGRESDRRIDPGVPFKEHQPHKIILFWNNFGTIEPYEFGLGHAPFVKHRCTIHNCMTTENRTLLPQADAVIFHVRGLKEETKHDLPKHAHAKQLFIFFTLESPIHTYHNMTHFNDYFNLTFTYRADSDIYCPMGKVTRRPASNVIRNMNHTLNKIYSTKTKMVAWVISKCDKLGSMRWEYGKELAKHIPLDIFGKCGTLKCPKSHFGLKCYTMISNKYKFYLGFENSFCKDYSTEKLWRTIQYDLVPIVLGGANYSRDLPPRSYIDVRDFPSPKDLAHYLHYLNGHRDDYLSYFRWKETLRLRTVTNLRRDGFCKLCEMLLMPDRYTYKSEFDVHTWWDTDGACLHGDELVRTLGLPHGTKGS